MFLTAGPRVVPFAESSYFDWWRAGRENARELNGGVRAGLPSRANWVGLRPPRTALRFSIGEIDAPRFSIVDRRRKQGIGSSRWHDCALAIGAAVTNNSAHLELAVERRRQRARKSSAAALLSSGISTTARGRETSLAQEVLSNTLRNQVWCLLIRAEVVESVDEFARAVRDRPHQLIEWHGREARSASAAAEEDHARGDGAVSLSPAPSKSR
jgi:hypothetical protein